MSNPRILSSEKPQKTRFSLLIYIRVFCSQLPRILDTSQIDVIVDTYDTGFLHVANIFPRGRWRAIALLRFFSHLTLVLAIPLLPLYWFLLNYLHIFWKLLIRTTPAFAAFAEETAFGTRRLNVPINVAKPLEDSVWRSSSKKILGATPLSRLVWSLWAFNADAETFEKMYVQAWMEYYVHNRNKVVPMVSIFVDNEVVRVPIPWLVHSDEGPQNDRHTCEALLMWYSWLRVKKGFGEILLPKRLVRIDKVKLAGGDQSLGRRLRTLEFGRNGESSVQYLSAPAKIPEEQTSLTAAVMDNSDSEGLEFIRAWDTFTISIITLLPLVLSLAFAGAWIGVSIRNHQVDAQVATQTAFTVASYIITAGALVIALFAFLDSSSYRSGAYADNNTPQEKSGDDNDSRSRQRSPPRDPSFRVPSPARLEPPGRWSRDGSGRDVGQTSGSPPRADSDVGSVVEVVQTVKHEGSQTYREL